MLEKQQKKDMLYEKLYMIIVDCERVCVVVDASIAVFHIDPALVLRFFRIDSIVLRHMLSNQHI